MWRKWRRGHDEERHDDDDDDVEHQTAGRKGAADHMATARNRSGPIGGHNGGHISSITGYPRAGGAAQTPQQQQQQVRPHEAFDPRVIDPTDSMAAWLHQTNRDPSNWSFVHLANRPEFGEIIWDMRERGEKLRMQVAKWLFYKYRLALTPDPREQIPFRAVTVLTTAARHLGLTLLMASDVNGLARVLDEVSIQKGMPVYAWIQCYVDGRPPDLIVDPSSPNYIVPFGTQGEFREYSWSVLHAADCIAQLLKNSGLYVGPVTQGGRIMPPNPVTEPAPTTPIHMFRKALLGMGKECGPHAPCKCDSALWELRQVPADHPQETGALSRNPYAQHQQQQPMPPTMPPTMPPMPQPPYPMPETDPRLPASWRDDTPTHFPQARHPQQNGSSGRLPPRASTGPVIPPRAPRSSQHLQQQRGQDTPVLPALPETLPENWPDEEGG